LKTFVVCDIQNIFHGLIRTTGDPRARVDYVKLKRIVTHPGEETLLTAYIVTPVASTEIQEKSLIPPEQQTGFIDDSFVELLKRLGYKVRRSFCSMKVNETAEVRHVNYVRTSMAHAVYQDVREVLAYYDKVVLVSGAGALLPTANMVKEAGKVLWVVAFIRAGDLNSEYRRIADKILPLNDTLRWSGGKTKSG